MIYPVEESTEVSKLNEFRDDLRPPHVVFGRCGVTGMWGKCVTVDLGDILIETPDTERGVTIEDGEVAFANWKPVVFQNQLTLSEDGLRKLLAFTESQENPIPAVTPDLVYKWSVLYGDGSAISQFIFEDDAEVEVNSNEIDFERINQISLVERRPQELPTFTFVKETGKFFCDGVEIDTMYDGPYFPEAPIVYCRKIAHTWGSHMGDNGLDRQIANVHTSVLQILGWKVGGFEAFIVNSDSPGCIIAIDDRGHWRPYSYSYEHR